MAHLARRQAGRPGPYDSARFMAHLWHTLLPAKEVLPDWHPVFRELIDSPSTRRVRRSVLLRWPERECPHWRGARNLALRPSDRPSRGQAAVTRAERSGQKTRRQPPGVPLLCCCWGLEAQIKRRGEFRVGGGEWWMRDKRVALWTDVMLRRCERRAPGAQVAGQRWQRGKVPPVGNGWSVSVISSLMLRNYGSEKLDHTQVRFNWTRGGPEEQLPGGARSNEVNVLTKTLPPRCGWREGLGLKRGSRSKECSSLTV